MERRSVGTLHVQVASTATTLLVCALFVFQCQAAAPPPDVASNTTSTPQTLEELALLVTVDAHMNIPNATLEEQLAESQIMYQISKIPAAASWPITCSFGVYTEAILLEMKAAWNNHPVFGAALWNEATVDAASGVALNATESLPCSSIRPWHLISCHNDHVTGILLDGTVYAQPSERFPMGNPAWEHGATPGPVAGPIPWALITRLPFLVKILLQSNDFTGEVIPENISDLDLLRILIVRYNKNSGPLPEGITDLVHLVTLDVSDNGITGPLPANMDKMKSLTTFHAQYNKITGPIPAELANMKNLTSLDIGDNLFSGPIPSFLGNLDKLRLLSLHKSQLNGSIPASFANLKRLQELFLSQNDLEGPFPAWIGNLTSLVTLSLGSNRFYGSVPSNLWAPANLTTVHLELNYLNGTAPAPPADRKAATLSYQSNCFESGSSSEVVMKSSSACTAFYSTLYPVAVAKKKGVPVVAIVLPLLVALALLLLAVLLFLRKRKNEKLKLEHLFGKNLKQMVKQFSLAELRRATKDFNQVIGRGGYGTVYKAVLSDTSLVAVKRLDQVSKQGDVEFIREVELLSRLHHRHLVNLLGFCAEKGERMLVYEFMAMGSLYEHIHGPNAKAYPLSWESRTKIGIHIALGLEYLHHGADPPLIHRDIKSSNILLGADGYCKVSDFGLCKEAPLGADGSGAMVPTATAVRGSFGYLDPEYVNTSVLSEKSDVYSYGVVLLELITGHKSIHEWQPLAYWAEEYLSDREKTPLMVDPSLRGEFDIEELYAICDIARTCVQDQAILRPTIRHVAKSLVETLGVSCNGSVNDSASVMSSCSERSTTGLLGVSFTGTRDLMDLSYQKYSETLHWGPEYSGKLRDAGLAGAMSPASGKGCLPLPTRVAPSLGMKSTDNNV